MLGFSGCTEWGGLGAGAGGWGWAYRDAEPAQQRLQHPATAALAVGSKQCGRSQIPMRAPRGAQTPNRPPIARRYKGCGIPIYGIPRVLPLRRTMNMLTPRAFFFVKEALPRTASLRRESVWLRPHCLLPTAAEGRSRRILQSRLRWLGNSVSPAPAPPSPQPHSVHLRIRPGGS